MSEQSAGQQFHDRMHELVFRGVGASKLGAVQTTVVWQFVIFHYPQLTDALCNEIVKLQTAVNEATKNSEAMENAIAALLNRVKQLDTGGR